MTIGTAIMARTEVRSTGDRVWRWSPPLLAVLASIRSTFRTASRAPTRDVREGVKAALRFIRRRRDVATLLGVGFGNSFAFGAVLGLTVPYAVEVLGFDRDDGRVGFLFAASGVGSLVSGLLFARVFRTGRVPILTPLTLLVSGCFALLLAGTTSGPVALVLFAAFSLSMTTTITIGITYRQLAAPDDLRSSVNVLEHPLDGAHGPESTAAANNLGPRGRRVYAKWVVLQSPLRR